MDTSPVFLEWRFTDGRGYPEQIKAALPDNARRSRDFNPHWNTTPLTFNAEFPAQKNPEGISGFSNSKSVYKMLILVVKDIYIDNGTRLSSLSIHNGKPDPIGSCNIASRIRS